MSEGGDAPGYPGPATFLAARGYNLGLAAAVIALFGAGALAGVASGLGGGRGAWAVVAICAGLAFYGGRAFLRNLYPRPATLRLDAQGFELSPSKRRFLWSQCREAERGAFFAPFAWPLDMPTITFRTLAPDSERLLERRVVNVFEPKTVDLAATMEAWRLRACDHGRHAASPRA